MAPPKEKCLCPVGQPPLVPDLNWYDLVLLNTSGGKDSLAMLGFVVRQAKKQRALHLLQPIHAELGGIVWPGMTEMTRCQCRHLGLRELVVVESKNYDLLGMVLDRSQTLLRKGDKSTSPWPYFQIPKCTADLKATPITAYISARVDEFCGGPRKACAERPYRVLNVMGLRCHESPRRCRFPRYEVVEDNSRRIVHRWLPVFDYTADDVWREVEQTGAAVPATYSQAISRYSCPLCVNASYLDQAKAVLELPALAQRYMKVEQQTGHPFTKGRSVADVVEWARKGLEVPPRGNKDALDGVHPCMCDVGW